MKDKKIVYGILLAIAVASAIIIAVMGLNVDLRYTASKQVKIYIGQEFKNEDIKTIVKEVVGNQALIIRKVETFEDIAEITIKDISSEEIEKINEKINEKYGIDNNVEDIEITNISNVRIRDIVRPYVLPIGISLAIILVYAGIRYRKIEILEVLASILGYNIFAQLVFLCVLAITRLPFNITTLPTALVIYVIITIVIINEFEKRQDSVATKKKK